jgi:LacI family transcriptional regulator
MDVTLNDIAKRAKVSKVTVHKVIYGKNGVSARTRQRVLEIVQEMGYEVNLAAASLKRDRVRIAVVSPQLEPELNYFFRGIDQGIAAAENALAVFKVAIERIHCGGSWQDQADILDRLADRGDVDGVVIFCWDDTKLDPHFARLQEQGIPVVTFHSDAPGSCRIASVPSPSEQAGGLAAELLGQLVPLDKGILVLGGLPVQTTQQENTRSFYKYIRAYRPDLFVMQIDDYETIPRLMEETRRILSGMTDIAGIYCNSARNNIPLCRLLQDMGLSRKVSVVTSDVFEELREFLEVGTINATIWQDPQTQSSVAIVTMYEYLTKKKLPPVRPVRTSLVMKSNFDDYL